MKLNITYLQPFLNYTIKLLEVILKAYYFYHSYIKYSQLYKLYSLKSYNKT